MSASRSPKGKQQQERRNGWDTKRRHVIKVPGGAVLRGCKKTKRKLMAHLQLRAEAQPASMEWDCDYDSKSDCDSEPEPVTQPTPRRCSARLAALAPAAASGPPLPLDSEDPVMLRQLQDFSDFFANPNFKTVYNQLQRHLPAASEPGPNAPPPAKRSKRTKAEQATAPTQPTKGKGHSKAAQAKPAPQPGRWLDRDYNAALDMQRIGESRWRPLELCYWPEQGALPAKGKEYPGLGYKRL
ncbi:hypothetical protein QJQ45_009495 [Haematococcus lacustris]|nr:hypothetical protein QJQ45_009495 [Haematococcus lacustris]